MGSVVFFIPFPVEGGVFDLAAYFLPIRIVGGPRLSGAALGDILPDGSSGADGGSDERA